MITTPGSNQQFGHLSEAEFRHLVLELASRMYSHSYDVFTAAHAQALLDAKAEVPGGAKKGGGKHQSASVPAFDDSPLNPVWLACLTRARQQVWDMTRLETDITKPVLRTAP